MAGMKPQLELQALVPEPEGAGGVLAVPLLAMTQLATGARRAWAVSSLYVGFPLLGPLPLGLSFYVS